MSDPIQCECGSVFWREPHETWKRHCLDCWKESRSQPAYTSSGNRDTAIEDRLRRELDGWKLRAQRAETSLARHTCPPAALDLETLKRIRLLVHPDKHANSQAANQVTQQINELIRRAS
jgi:hypothetical protein